MVARANLALPAPLLVALALAALLLSTGAAHAQTRETVLWVAGAAEDADVDAADVESVLREVLAGASDTTHLVGRDGIRDALEDGVFAVPRCLEGLEPCASTRQAVLQSLGVDLVIELVAHEDGEELDVSVLDGAGNPRSTERVTSTDLRAAVFAAVAAATGATARLAVDSSPVPAQVFVNGEAVGATPWHATLPVGLYRVTLLADGYFDDTTNVELRAGESRTVEAELDRRFAELIVRSGTPGAQLFIGDDAAPLEVNVPHRLDPGSYVVTVAAADYTPQTRQLDLAAGDDRVVSLNLLIAPQTIRRQDRERILAAPLMLQLGVHLDASRTSLSGAHGTAFDRELTLRCPANPPAVSPTDPLGSDVCGEPSRFFSPAVEADVLYAWRFVEVGIVGIGFRMLPLSRDGRSFLARDGLRYAEVESGRAITLRLPSVGLRWLFGPYIEPFARTGPVLDFERFKGREGGIALTPDETFFRRNALWWEGRAGVRWHVNTLMYAWADAHVAADLSHGDPARLGATLGVGLNLGDPFGLDRALDARFPRRGERSDTSDMPATEQLPGEL